MSESMVHFLLSEQPLQATAAKTEKKPIFTPDGINDLGIQLHLRLAE